MIKQMAEKRAETTARGRCPDALKSGRE